MDYRTRMEYFKTVYQRYRKASRAEKGRILDEFCQSSGLNRKYAIAKFNGPLETPQDRVRQRGVTYTLETLRIVEDVWKRSGYPWSKRLTSVLRDWMPWIRQRYRLGQGTEEQLLEISARQLDRRLAPLRKRIKRRIYGRTKPGKILKHQIPIRAVHWDVRGPGWTEVDLVSHSGSNSSGEFAYTLTLTDIYTGLVETRAVLGKGESTIVHALEEIEAGLPFRLKGIDSDNGSEFINAQLYRHCKSRGIVFTRGRPYAKEDNAHVEQKNWTHVRRLIGYERYDTPAAVAAMNELYRGDLGRMMNLFSPSVKLKRKVRVGSRLRRKHDEAKTPLQRLASCGLADRIAVGLLKRLKNSLDPFVLSDSIDAQLRTIHGLADRRTHPRGPLPRTRSKSSQRLNGLPMSRLGFRWRDNPHVGLGS